MYEDYLAISVFNLLSYEVGVVAQLGKTFRLFPVELGIDLQLAFQEITGLVVMLLSHVAITKPK